MPQKILVVENSAEYRELMQRVIEALGYEASVTDRATTAWKMLQSGPVDLVLLDIKMPVVSGDQFVNWARQRGFDTPVIAVSGYLTPKVVERLKRHGIRRVVAKPFKIERLANEIHEILGDPDV